MTSPPPIPVPRAPYFDQTLKAWVLTRYEDVLAALREPRLTAAGARGGGGLERAAHLRFRREAGGLVAEMLDDPRLADAEALAHDIASRLLAKGQPVDLVSELARPWALQLADCLCRPHGDPARIHSLAGDIFAAAAEPLDGALQSRAEASTVALSACFPGRPAAFYLQAYVALSQTLPCFLAGAWLALQNDREQAMTLQQQPGLMPAAIEELLRHSGPAQAQFRRASEEVVLGGAAIQEGDRAALMIAAANRDPAQFPGPDRLDFRRPGDTPRHLAFGEGSQSCVGAPLVRAASAVATTVFVQHFCGAAMTSRQPAAWRGGFAISAPACLWVSPTEDLKSSTTSAGGC